MYAASLLLRALGILVRVLMWTLLAAIMLLGSALYHVRIPLARNIAREMVNSFVTGEIRGELAIGRFDELDLDYVVARHVTLYDGEGRRIVVADRVEVTPDFAALLRSFTLRFRVGRILHGTARLVNDEAGDPSLFTTFDPRHPRPPGVPRGKALHALVDQIELVDMTLYGQMIALEGVRAEHVNAAGRLELIDELEIQIHRGEGKVVRPFDLPGEIAALSGTISTDKMRGVKLDMRAVRAPDEVVDATLRYRSAAPTLAQELELDIDTPGVTTDTLRKLGYTFAGPLAPRLHGHVNLSGPPANLALTAHIESVAGNAEVTGAISTAQGVSVHVTTQSMIIDKLVDDAPTVTMRGLLDISVPDSESKPHVHAEIAGLRYKGVIVPPFALDGELEDNSLKIERARATQGGQIALRGRVGFDGHTDLHVDAHFAAVERDPNLSRFAENLEGSLTASVHIRTPEAKKQSTLDITGRLELLDAHFGSLRASRLTLEGAALGDPKLPKLDVRVQGDEFQVLSYALGSARFALQGGPNTYTAKGEFEAKGQKTFNFDATVAANLEGFVIQAEPIEFTVGDESWRGQLRDLAVIHDREIKLGFLRLASRAQRLEAKGILRVQQEGKTKPEDSLEAQLQNFDLTAVRALLGERFPITHGYADANLILHGDVAKPVMSLTGAVREAKLLDLDMFDALYSVDYENGKLELDSDFDLNGRGALQLSGQGELDPTLGDTLLAIEGGLYNLELTGTDVDATLIPALKPLLHTGKLNGTVAAQGGMRQVTMSGKLSANQLYTSDWLPIQVQTTFKYDHDDLSAKVVAKDARGPFVNGDVTWQIDWRRLHATPSTYLPELLASNFHVSGETLDRALDDLPFPVRYANAWPLRAASMFDVTRDAGKLAGELRGTLKPKQLLSDSSCQLSAASELQTSWRVDNDQASMDFDVSLDGQSVAAGNGRVDWPFDAFLRGEPTGTPSADLTGHADIAQMERVPGLCQHGRGQLHTQFTFASLFSDKPSGEISLRTTLTPEVRVASGATNQRVVTCKNEPLELELTARADGQMLRFDGSSRGCGGGPGTVRAQLPVEWSAAHPTPILDDKRQTQIDLDLRDTELAPALDYLPGVLGFSGQASGQLSARAQRGKVAYQGQLALSGGRLYLLSTGQDLTDVSLGLTAHDNWVKLDDVHASVGRGALDVEGGIGLDRWLPRRFQLGVVLRELPLQREGLDLAWLNGSAAVVGELAQDHSDTAVKIHALSVRLPNTTTRSPQSLEPHPDITLTTEAHRTKPEKPYSFKFVVDGRRGVTARRNDFDATLSAEVALEYEDPSLRVGGYVEFQRGTFEVFGKSFEINRGSMRFDGSTELNPEVTLVATHDPDAVGGAPVVVNVSGTVAKPEVSFYSERCPGEGAVVLLLSGRCPSEADITTSNNPNATQDAFLSGIIGGVLTLGARSQLGGLIPRLAVERTASGTRTRVKAGFETVPKFMRSLVQRVYVQGAVSASDANTGQATMQSTQATPDFLIELYFPNSIVGSGRVAPITRSWGLDVTWEP